MVGSVWRATSPRDDPTNAPVATNLADVAERIVGGGASGSSPGRNDGDCMDLVQRWGGWREDRGPESTEKWNERTNGRSRAVLSRPSLSLSLSLCATARHGLSVGCAISPERKPHRSPNSPLQPTRTCTHLRASSHFFPFGRTTNNPQARQSRLFGAIISPHEHNRFNLSIAPLRAPTLAHLFVRRRHGGLHRLGCTRRRNGDRHRHRRRAGVPPGLIHSSQHRRRRRHHRHRRCDACGTRRDRRRPARKPHIGPRRQSTRESEDGRGPSGEELEHRLHRVPARQQQFREGEVRKRDSWPRGCRGCRWWCRRNRHPSICSHRRDAPRRRRPTVPGVGRRVVSVAVVVEVGGW